MNANCVRPHSDPARSWPHCSCQFANKMKTDAWTSQTMVILVLDRSCIKISDLSPSLFMPLVVFFRLKDDLTRLTRETPKLELCSSLFVSRVSSDVQPFPGSSSNSLSPKLSSSVSFIFNELLESVLWPFVLVFCGSSGLLPLYSEQVLLKLSDLKQSPFVL